MSYTSNPLMNAIATKLSWLSARQATISQNLANANTPNYQARDVEKPDFGNLLQRKDNAAREVKSAKMRQTSDKHINVGMGGPSGEFEILVDDKKPFDSKLSGNNVVLEEQMIDMAQTQLDYATMINLYRRHVGLLKTAIGKKA